MASTSPFPSQPNLDVSGAYRTWHFRFWLMTALTGAAAGLAGSVLMRLLLAVEQAAWRYDAGTLLEAAARASATRHVLALLGAGILVGIGGGFLRKAQGHSGGAEAAIWFRSGQMKFFATLAQAVHSILTVGMGVSLGRESPIKQAGGAIASGVARLTGLSRPEQRVLVACGVGAGMAAAYNVPVGGALFAVEVLLGSITLRFALPALLCSGVATAASWLLLPTGPIYQVPEFPLSMQLTVWALVAGPVLGLATIPLVRAIGWADAHRPRGRLRAFGVPVIFLTLLGVVSIAFPQLLGNGKDAVQIAYSDQLSISLLAVLPLLKLIATAGCLGSGASGGLFTPTMTIGALLGGLFGHAWERIWPGASMGSCAVIGSCAFLAAASQGPISALVLVLELTRHIDATMVPMLLAVAGAMMVARRIESRSIYSIRLHLTDVRATLETVPDLGNFGHQISRDFEWISSATGYARVAESVLSQRLKMPVYVIDHDGGLMGIIDEGAIESPALGAMPLEAAKAADFAVAAEALDTGMSAGEIAERLAGTNARELPMVDAKTDRMVGVVANANCERD